MSALITVAWEKVGDALLVHITGDADTANSPQLEMQLTRVSAQHPPLVILDLAGLSFLSSLAMGVLVAMQRGIAQRGGQVRMTALQAPVEHAIRRTHLDRIFPIYATLDAAMTPANVP